MKRVGRLFDAIVDRDNLRLGFLKACRGKRDRHVVYRFARGLERRLAEMADKLRQGTFPLGRCTQFLIHDPKERIITAPYFGERVLHHAIMNVCEPILDRWLIPDSYACRQGRGRIAALCRAQHFARRYPFFLKLDIRKYFDSISHDRLLERLTRRFKDGRLLQLLGRIIWAFRGGLGRGLPIGSLTSQHFANYYLGWFDRFVKEELRLPGYVRYMDDMVLWAASTGFLQEALQAAQQFLKVELALECKPTPDLNRTAHGMDFLGCRIYPSHMTLNRRSRVRYARKLRRLERQFAEGTIESVELQQRATALTAFTQTAELSSWHFRTGLLQRLAESGHRAPCE
jgi:hypothetical protein